MLELLKKLLSGFMNKEEKTIQTPVIEEPKTEQIEEEQIIVPKETRMPENNSVVMKCFEYVMKVEGGEKYSLDKNDPGNWTGGKVGVGELKGTKYGVACSAYPTLDIKNLTKEQACEIFKRDYWDKCKCDELPNGINLLVVDCAYNSGVSRSIKILQKSLNTDVDGIIGPGTLYKVKQATGSYEKLQQLSWDLRDNRIDFLKALSTWQTYGKGWRNRVDMIFDWATFMR